jgi:chitin disaccharide deacetylase
MPPQKHLIVNADDFGLCPGVNQGVIQAHQDGIVTSASLMVRWPAAEQAAAYARSHPRLSVGLHIDLCEWIFAGETWRPAYEVVPTHDADAVADEVARQLGAFQRLLGRNPTHLDSHQHVHRSEPVLSILLQEARNMGITLRDQDRDVMYCGEFYGQSNKGYPYPEGISVEALLKIIQHLPPGITELGCHPGKGADIDSVYGRERSIECHTLCDPRIKEAANTHNIVLCSFADLETYGVRSPTR